MPRPSFSVTADSHDSLSNISLNHLFKGPLIAHHSIVLSVKLGVVVVVFVRVAVEVSWKAQLTDQFDKIAAQFARHIGDPEFARKVQSHKQQSACFKNILM